LESLHDLLDSETFRAGYCNGENIFNVVNLNTLSPINLVTLGCEVFGYLWFAHAALLEKMK
jgi:hypothetical protein